MNKRSIIILIGLFLAGTLSGQSWIRINQLGYLPQSVKVAVCISTDGLSDKYFTVHNAITGTVVFKDKARHYSGEEWGMRSAARLDFSKLETPGGYFIRFGNAESEAFSISADVYRGTSDFLLEYMRQQRCGYNPFYGDSCHVHDAIIVDHPEKSGQRIDVTGGWHDATDYLQYTCTSANAVYQMLYAYRRNPEVFGDSHDASGNPGSNGIPDILDEARWGIDWLLKMNPDSGEMYNQIADDRDHAGFRLPAGDKASYGLGVHRPVYFVTGKSQGLSRYSNRSTGVSSTAGKFASAFAIGAEVFRDIDSGLADRLRKKAEEAWRFGLTDLGTTQTACVVSPYFYEEDNYVDDLELAAIELFSLTGDSAYLVQADYWGTLERISPWIEMDTARHYQFYPFVNLGHAGLAKSGTRYSGKFISFMRRGLQILEDRKKNDPFRIKIPFIWCSNNYVTAALTQYRIYAEVSGDSRFAETEAAHRDWLFGCNPWGTSMITGLPEGGDYPRYPHASVTVLSGIIPPGGLVDGPIYRRIYDQQIGLTLTRPDPYAPFQNGKAIYHDDTGDYSSNEPTMDGTADLTIYMSALESEGLRQTGRPGEEVIDDQGAIIRKNNKKEIYLLFSADDHNDGFDHILDVLSKTGSGASFFLTGNFLRNPGNEKYIRRIVSGGHFAGPHSDRHLLYAPWEKRDSLLVDREQFVSDLRANYRELAKRKAGKPGTLYFLPPYEWYNSAIAHWTSSLGIKLINFTPGTGTNADYTTPDMSNYRSSDELLEGLKRYEASDPRGLRGAMILIHPGTHPDRTDKLYLKLGEIITFFSAKGYIFKSL
ncbi:MAG TPA: glycoside hydrolase family 9 protein [Bacteroidales bacterium]|jgi:peptidoglycan/xylan/chitin deacetylase (PgdA/CDA1 family)|nr:glycoside hydrolase family 9 protein [Bacteroidales bacterium]HQH25229.1 glycoside hydrolase family 9 protein [Bacteroidales bacterium]HQJ82774.1 glycoside hydrolase family 9 protein [Bacteroidales bacterium]